MNILSEYFIYRYTAKSKFRIHSPFVFDFVTKCMTVEMEKTTKEKLKKIKKNYADSTEQIEINDLGAGSKKLKKHRKIAAIAKTSASKGNYALLLYQLVRHYKCAKILELGTSLGIGTFHLASANDGSQITTVDACLETQNRAIQTAKDNGFTSINFVHSDFTSFIEQNQAIYDLIFIDGHHDGTALLTYLEQLKKYAHAETIFVIDDIRWSTDMRQAWEYIKAEHCFHLSLDLFRMGIVIPRPEQAKEHFNIHMKGVRAGMI